MRNLVCCSCKAARHISLWPSLSIGIDGWLYMLNLTFRTTSSSNTLDNRDCNVSVNISSIAIWICNCSLSSISNCGIQSDRFYKCVGGFDGGSISHWPVFPSSTGVWRALQCDLWYMIKSMHVCDICGCLAKLGPAENIFSPWWRSDITWSLLILHCSEMTSFQH